MVGLSNQGGTWRPYAWAFSVVVAFFSGCDDSGPGITSATPEIVTDLDVAPPAHYVLRPARGPGLRNVGVKEGGSRFAETIRMKNTSGEAIRLATDQLITSCGCAKAELSSSELKPGEECDLYLEVNVPTMELSNQIVTVTVPIANPPDLPPGKFGVQFDATVGWIVSPVEFRPQAPPSSQVTLPFRVLGEARRDLRIIRITTNVPSAEIDFKDATIRKGSPLSGTLKMTLPDQAGTFAYAMTVETDDPLIPSRDIPIICKVVPRYDVVPAKVLIGLGGEARIERVLTVRAKEPFQLSVSSDETSPVRGEPSASEAGNVWQVKLLVDATELGIGSHKSVLTLLAGTPGREERIDVPVQIIRQ